LQLDIDINNRRRTIIQQWMCSAISVIWREDATPHIVLSDRFMYDTFHKLFSVKANNNMKKRLYKRIQTSCDTTGNDQIFDGFRKKRWSQVCQKSLFFYIPIECMEQYERDKRRHGDSAPVFNEESPIFLSVRKKVALGQGLHLFSSSLRRGIARGNAW
jgi:hypothetical protein